MLLLARSILTQKSSNPSWTIFPGDGQSPAVHGGVAQNTVEDLEFGDQSVKMLFQPRLSLPHVRVDGFRNPTVSLTEQADEVRPTPLDFCEAEGKNMAFRARLVGYAPTQVDLTPPDATTLAEFAQLRKNDFRQMIAFRVHIAEGR